METKELFKFQLENNNPITEESLKIIKEKTYFNGEKKEIGEVVLFAMIVGDIIEKEGDINELPIKLITINERHLDQFIPFKRAHQEYYGTNILPIIKQKTK